VRPLHRPHFLATVILVGLTGTATGVAAASHVGPFDALDVAHQSAAAAHLQPPPLRADSLFPKPTQAPAVHEQLVVVDPPPPAHSAPVRAAATPPAEDPSPAPSASPTPQPCGDDDCGGGGG
jgi:hypothetical protein